MARATSWLAEGKSNEEIATNLGVGMGTTKAHMKAIYERIGSDGRVAAPVIAHSTPLFATLPPSQAAFG
ncbi:helix-turn-helix domain-containing protein [Rhizobium sp. GCM10022189]|uniref:helix-turn-helix domain-containing protein n=1 Tax=Rhizobium sp. GCM10022189 TaxID=3252654 RepID=UPI003620E7B0